MSKLTPLDLSPEANREPGLCIVCAMPARHLVTLALSLPGTRFDRPNRAAIAIDYPVCDEHSTVPRKLRPKWTASVKRLDPQSREEYP